MDYIPGNDQVENFNQGDAYDTADLENRLITAEDASAGAEKTPPATDQPAPPNTDQPGSVLDKVAGDLHPPSAYGEKAASDRVETGAEKPEVKDFHPGGPERGF